jgi:uncharacterized protein
MAALPGPPLLACVALWLALATTPAVAARPAPAGPAAVRAADSLAARPPAPERDRALAEWAKHAALADLVYVLRRDPAELGAAGAPLLEAALAWTPEARAELARLLRLRLALADPRRAQKVAGTLAPGVAALERRLFASPFRVALVVPDTGDYAGYGAEVRAGFEAALAVRAAGEPRPLEGRVFGTDGGASRLAAALDSAAGTCGIVVGELLSGPTLALACVSRLAGVPAISPTATDEGLGEASPALLQIGPSGHERGAALARAMLASGPRRVGALVSSAGESATLVPGFLDAARGGGATVAWSGSYAAGTQDFRAPVRALVAARVEVLAWDGESGEADALLAELARQRATVLVCGGPALAPERHHGEARRLFEGVRWVAEDWALPAAEQAALDSVLRARGGSATDGLAARGWLAADIAVDAVARGALAPGEIAEALSRRVTAESWGRARRFLDGAGRGCSIPVWVVQEGRGVPAQSSSVNR